MANRPCFACAGRSSFTVSVARRPPCDFACSVRSPAPFACCSSPSCFARRSSSAGSSGATVSVQSVRGRAHRFSRAGESALDNPRRARAATAPAGRPRAPRGLPRAAPRASCSVTVGRDERTTSRSVFAEPSCRYGAVANTPRSDGVSSLETSLAMTWCDRSSVSCSPAWQLWQRSAKSAWPRADEARSERAGVRVVRRRERRHVGVQVGEVVRSTRPRRPSAAPWWWRRPRGPGAVPSQW